MNWLGACSFIVPWLGTIQHGALVIHCAHGRDNTVDRGPWSFIVSRVGTIPWVEDPGHSLCPG